MSKPVSSRRKLPFVKGKRLGSGSFGIVHLGIRKKEFDTSEQSNKSRKIPKYVCLKYIKEDVTASTIKQERDNLNTVKRLPRHPNIIGFLGEFQDKRRTVFVFEYAEGGDLYSCLSKQGTFSEADTRDVVRDVLNGLLFLHRHGIIHRDIKPANILLRKGFPGPAAITDFGISSFAGSGEMIPFNREGTMAYSPPEAFKYNVVGRRSDIWPVGIVMYELLMGEPPFGNNFSSNGMPIEITKKILNFRNKKYKHISIEGRDLMSKLLRKHPNHRPKAQQALEHPWFSRAPNEKTFLGSRLKDLNKHGSLRRFSDVKPLLYMLLKTEGRRKLHKMRLHQKIMTFTRVMNARDDRLEARKRPSVLRLAKDRRQRKIDMRKRRKDGEGVYDINASPRDRGSVHNDRHHHER